MSMEEYTPPAYCVGCGKPFPWTKRQIQAALELFADELSVSAEEAKEFEKNLHTIAQDAPAAQVASNRIMRALKKVGEGTANAIRDILKSIASEAARRTLFP
jgi:hypothetical protein